jgi:hypothetical protein
MLHLVEATPGLRRVPQSNSINLIDDLARVGIRRSFLVLLQDMAVASPGSWELQ